MFKKPNLIFDKGPMSSFATLAEQSDLNPTTVVRELVQNSLDAANEAGQKQAIIRFELAKCKPDEIPAFDAYKAAFKNAKNAPINTQDSAQSVINSIEKQINSAEIETLFVMDNGIGLSARGMDALLSEGISNKSNRGAGSYGYGHTTVIPASDLRYMLYGGLCDDGAEIAAGHAVLASFKDGREIKGKDGYFVVKKNEDMEEPFTYVEGKAIPPIIKNKLNTIKSEWGSGSVVIIPSFNHFRETKDEIEQDISPLNTSGAAVAGLENLILEYVKNRLWENIKEAVAFNFFAAVYEGKLKIEYKKGEDIQTLDKKNINKVLEKHKDVKRGSQFLNGYRAKRAYDVMALGKDHTVKTSLGDIKIKLCEGIKDGKTQIDLCRNGMHITGSVPFLERKYFANFATFHCVVLVDASNGEFHRLIRKAEPPRHNDINRKNLDSNEKSELNGCLKEIVYYLKEFLPELEAEEFRVTDVLNLKSYGVNTLEELPPRIRAGGTGSGGSGGRGNSTKSSGGSNKGGGFKRAGRAVSFRATPVQTGKRSYAVQIALEESKHENEIRFALDESLDLTCDNSNAEDLVHLKNIKIDGQKVEKENLIKNDKGKILGINLGSGEGRQVNLTFDFSLPDDAGIDAKTLVSLQAEMVRRQAEKAE